MPAGVNVPSTHDAACPQATVLAATTHAPSAPHVPVLPQGLVLEVGQRGLHVPVASQAWHVPQTGQHTLLTHVKGVAQLFAVQDCPADPPEHFPVAVLQPMPLAQSESAAHEVAHTVPLHLKSPQDFVAGVEHTPAPLHIEAFVCVKLMPLPVHLAAAHAVVVEAGQVSCVPSQVAAAMDERLSVEHMAVRQVVSVDRLAQAPPPAHRPVFPHIPVPAAGRQPESEVPAVTLLHVPFRFPPRLHA